MLRRTAPLLTLLAGLALIVLPLVLFDGSKQAAAADDELKPTSRPYLWKVTYPGCADSWLFGTVHVGHPAVTTLSPEVDAAIDGADALYCELAMDAHGTMKMTMATMLGGGKSLKEVLPADLYADIDTFLQGYGMGIAPLGRFKPWALEMQLSMLGEMELMANPALDAQLYARAKNAKKEVGGIETIEEQLAVFETMPLDKQVESLRETLVKAKKARDEGDRPLRELLKIYLAGDPQKLMEHMFEEFDPTDEEQAAMLVRLLDDRNVRMAERSANKMKEAADKSFFFAYGAAHFPGEKGVIALLEKEGFTVERVGAGVKAKSKVGGGEPVR